MKSCIEWRKSFKFLPQIDEFNIDFKHKDKKLLDFLDVFAITQRVNIRIEPTATENDIELIIAIWEMNKYNIAVCFNFKYDKENFLYKKIKAAKIPFYFSYPINDWDELIGYINIGVSDVFITGILGFELNKINKVVKEKNIQVRCYCNICQSIWDEADSFKKFFIRPEDIFIYDEYIDVIEFFQSEEIQNVLYDIYFHTHKWVGNLQEIIKGLKEPINNYYILGNEFAEKRVKCGKKCLKGSVCQMCERIKELANTIENSDEYEVYERM